MNIKLLQRPIIRFGLLTAVIGLGLLLSCGTDNNPLSPPVEDDPEFRQVTDLSTVTVWEQVWGPDASDIFLMGEDGLVFRNQVGVWDSLNSTVDPDYSMHSAWGIAGNNMYFVGRIIRSDTVWIPTTDGDSIPVLQDEPVLDNFNGVNFNAEGLTGVDWGLFDIWGSAADDIFAVGFDGTIIHYNGTDWTPMHTGGITPVWLFGVWGLSDSSVYACGSGGAFLHYDGNAWNVIPSHTGENLIDIYGFSDSSIYMVSSNGTVLHYDGTDITRTGVADCALFSIWGLSEDDLYAVGCLGKIVHFDGNGWTTMPSGTEFALYSVWGTASDNIYAAGKTLLRYDGIDWLPVKVRNEPDFTDVWFGSNADLKEVIAVGTGGAVLKSEGGDIFTSMTVNGVTSTTDLNGVGGYDGKARFIVGNGGTVFQRDASDSSNWLDVSPGVGADLRAVAVLSSDLAFAVGTGGTLLEYDGNSWSPVAPVTSEDLNDVWIGVVSGDTVIHAVGNNGVTLFNNGSWTTPSAVTAASLKSVFGLPSGEIFAVGDAGTLLRNSSGTWTALTSGTTENLSSVWGDDDGNVFVAGASGRIFRWNGQQLSELETRIGANLNGIYGLTAMSFFAVGDANHILRYGF